jgi:hypothetical protein
MSISTYFKYNIHQNGPKILGVKKNHNVWIQYELAMIYQSDMYRNIYYRNVYNRNVYYRPLKLVEQVFN